MKIKAKQNDLLLFLLENLSAKTFSELHTELKISKRMLTSLCRNPKRFSLEQAKKISKLTGSEICDLFKFID